MHGASGHVAAPLSTSDIALSSASDIAPETPVPGSSQCQSRLPVKSAVCTCIACVFYREEGGVFEALVLPGALHDEKLTSVSKITVHPSSCSVITSPALYLKVVACA